MSYLSSQTVMIHLHILVQSKSKDVVVQYKSRIKSTLALLIFISVVLTSHSHRILPSPSHLIALSWTQFILSLQCNPSFDTTLFSIFPLLYRKKPPGCAGENYLLCSNVWYILKQTWIIMGYSKSNRIKLPC